MTTKENAVACVRNRKNYGMYNPNQELLESTGQMAEELGLVGFPVEIMQNYANNDAGNARRFLDVYGEDVRYCAGEKQWYICQPDMSWKPDLELLVEKLAYESVYASYAHQLRFYSVLNGNGQMQRTVTELEKQQCSIGNLSVLRNCIGMAQKDVPITPDMFDRYAHLFHMPNATLDVNAFACVPNQKEHYITRTAGVVYDCEAQCPRWEQFVMECVEGDMELYRYLQKATGYSILSGDISEQAVFCLLGSGKNGKSLFINTLAEVAGEYACKIDSAIISLNRRGDKDHDVSKELYRMKGSRFVYTGEFNKNTLLNEAFIKSITDGGKISCRPLYGASVEYQPTYTLWFSTNNAPELTGFDEGIQRRFVMIPFEHRVEVPDKTLPEVFCAEASGILNWLAEGYQLYTAEGLDKPESIASATKEYIAEQDVFQMFVDEYYEKDDNGKVYAKALYEQYRTWCQYNGEKPVSQVMLSRELLRLGVEKRKDMYGTFYCLRQYRQEKKMHIA